MPVVRILLVLVAGLLAVGLALLFWPTQSPAPGPGPVHGAPDPVAATPDVDGPVRSPVVAKSPGGKLPVSKSADGVRGPSKGGRTPFCLEGRVVDAFGHGIGDCVVLVEDRPAGVSLSESQPEPEPRGQVRSDSYGNFSLDLQGTGSSLGPLVVSLDAVRFPPTVARTDVTISRNRVRNLGALVLSSERGIEVRARSTDGAPIRDARLTLTPILEDPLLSAAALALARRAAITNVDGYAQFYGVTQGAYRIRAEAASFATREVTHHQGIASKASPLQIEMQRCGVQRGRVLAADGRSVPDASVFAVPVGGGPRTQTQTDAEGHFRLTGLLPGRYELEVQSTSFGTLRCAADLPDDGLELRLPAGTVLEGVVLSTDGSPLAGASLEARRLGWPLIRNGVTYKPDQTTTDAAGLFRIDDLPAGRYELAFSSDGLTTVFGPFAAGDTEIRIALVPPIVVRGSIVDARGNAVTGEIEVMNVQYDGSAFAEFTHRAIGAGVARHPVGENGFVLKVRPGAFRLRFTPDGLDHAAFVSRPFTADLAAAFTAVSLAAPIASTVAGIAYSGGEGSLPAADVTVHLDPVGDLPDGRRRLTRTAQTDRQGHFEISGVAHGSYELFYDTRDRQSAAEAAATRISTLHTIFLDAGANPRGQRIYR